MAIDMSTVKTIINNGNNKEIVKIEDSLGRVLWQKAVVAATLYADKSNTDQHYKFENNAWSSITWEYQGNPINIEGMDVWCYNGDIYYNDNSYSLKLNKSTMVWENFTWSSPGVIFQLSGRNIWTDGTDIYYSNSSSDQYRLVPGTTYWEVKTWTGLVNFTGQNIWTDGTNYYHSQGRTTYVLNKAQSSWSTIRIIPTSQYYGNGMDVWSDGTNTYYTLGSFSFVFDKTNQTWSNKTWNIPSGVTLYGRNIYKYNNQIYFAQPASPYTTYILDTATDTWTVGGRAPMEIGNNLWEETRKVGTDAKCYTE